LWVTQKKKDKDDQVKGKKCQPFHFAENSESRILDAKGKKGKVEYAGFLQGYTWGGLGCGVY